MERNRIGLGIIILISVSSLCMTSCRAQMLPETQKEQSSLAIEEEEAAKLKQEKADEVPVEETADEELLEEKTKVPTGSLKIKPAELMMKEQTSGNDTEAVIGSLHLTLPEGWQLEQRVEENLTQYVMTDIHTQCAGEEIEGHQEGYEHEIVITPYKISQMPETMLQLAEEIKEYFSVPVLRGVRGVEKVNEAEGYLLFGQNKDRQEKEYFLFSDSTEGEKELFHVKESAISSYQNDVEDFEDFMLGKLVGIKKGTAGIFYFDIIGEKEYYYLLNESTDDPLFLVMRSSYREQKGQMIVYRKGIYETTIAELSVDTLSPEYIAIRDMNGDGYEDILLKGWLLDPFHSLEYTDEDSFEAYLWDQEKENFTYITGEQTLAIYGDIRMKLQKDHEKLSDQQVIPDDLSEYLSGYILGSRENLRDVMSEMVSDSELTLEEVKELAKDNIYIKNELLSIKTTYRATGIWLRVDADNDGIEDVFLCEYLGGSCGPVYYYLFAGKEDGSYELTDLREELKEEFSFITWEGKNYLAKTTWEFTKKLVNGISLECYEQGEYKGGVWLAIMPEEGTDQRSIQTVYVPEEKYRSLEKELLELAKNYNAGDRIGYGTAEILDEDEYYRRSSDLDNDGEMERYRTPLWQTTNYSTVDYLEFKSEDEKIAELVSDLLYNDEGIPLNMWVEETEFGNIIFILYEDGLYDFHICGFKISDGKADKLIQVDCKVKTQVMPRIISALENRSFYH